MPYSEQRAFLPRRCKGMPEVYLVEDHPLLDGVDHVGKVYVGHMGTDKMSVKDCFDFEKVLTCPEGDVAEWKAQGLLQLEPGDYFFLRDPSASQEAKEDVLAMMVTGKEHHKRNAQVVNNFDKATQAILGPRKTRTATSTAFERTRCARKIQKKRCYSVGAAIQLSRRVVAPSASLAQKRKNIRAYQTMVKDLVTSTSDMLLNVQAALPDNCLKAFAANSELTGQPGVGKRQVHGTSSIQMNISAAGLSASDNRLGSQLGDFGCEHYDGRDSPDHLTTMFANPDIPKHYNPGAFHVLQLGAFAVLDKYVGVTFSGQRRHVGTAPTPPSDHPSAIDKSAYRFNVVCYPKDAAVDGMSRFSLASLPTKKQTRKSLARGVIAARKEGEVDKRAGKTRKKPMLKEVEMEVKFTDGSEVLETRAVGYEGYEVGSEGEEDERGKDGDGEWDDEGSEGGEGGEDEHGRNGDGEWDDEGSEDGSEGSSRDEGISEWGDGDLDEVGAGVERERGQDQDRDQDGGNNGAHGVDTSKMDGGGEGGEREKKRGVPAGFDPEPLYITPEMINMSDDTFVPHTTNRATFARSGHVIMDRESHITFIGRSLHQLNAYVWRQLPVEYSLSIDVSKMLESISYEDEAGNRVHLSGWPSAPNIHTTSTERSNNKEIWAAYREKVRQFIPRIAYRAFDYDEEEESEDGREDGVTENDVVALEGTGGNTMEAAEIDTDVEGDEALIEHALLGPRPALLDQDIGTTQPQEEGTGDESVEPSGTNPTYREVHLLEDHRSAVHPPSEPPHGDSCPNSSNTLPTSRDSGTTESTAIPSKRGAPAAENDSGQMDLYKRAKHDVVPTVAGSSAPTSRFPFLQNLTARLLSDEAEELCRDFDLALRGSIEGIQEFNCPELVLEYRSVLQDPTSYSAPGRIQHIQVQLRAHTAASAIQAIQTRRERFLVLLSSVHVWYWLDVVIKDKITTILRSQPSDPTRCEGEEDWLSTLVNLIKHGLLGRSDPIELDPYTHVSLLTLRSSLIKVSNPGRRIYLEYGTADDQQLLLTAVVSKAQNALMECLEYPPESDMKDRRRAWLMGTLVDVIGEEFLATRYAWDTWNNFSVKHFLGDTSHAYGANPELIQPFREALEAHPICQVGCDTWTAYNTFRLFLLDPRRSIEPPSPPGTTVVPFLVGVSGGSARSSNVTSPGTPRFSGLDTYLRGCLGCQSGTALMDAPLREFLRYMPDSRIPFREKAPSRVRIQGPGGPYLPSTIRTNAGLFSAVIYRGITYNSQFSRHPEAPLVFLDLADWESKIDIFKTKHIALTKAKNFFCRPDAYGHSIKGRSTGNAKIFWQAVKALDWPKKTVKLIPFKECLTLFRKGGFITMGELCCYLLTCDLHYAGICEAPTIQDVSSFMRTARGGSYRVLPVLGFGEVNEHPPQSLVEGALSTIEAHLIETFSQDERFSMGLDLICVEHILCKFKRAIDAKVASG